MNASVPFKTIAAHVVLRALFVALLLLPVTTALALYALPNEERMQWLLAVPFVFAAGESLARLLAGRKRWLVDIAALLLVLAYDYSMYGTSSVAVLSVIVYTGIIIYGTLRPKDGSIWSVPPGLFITSFFLYAIVTFFLQAEPDDAFYLRLLNAGGAVTLVVALFLFNRSMVRKESYSDNSGAAVSRSILWLNRLLVSVLGAVVLIVSFLSDISIWIRRLLSQIINQLKEWLASDPSDRKVGDVTSNLREETGFVEASEPNRWIDLLGTIMLYLGSALAVAAVLWSLYRLARKLPFIVRLFETWIQRMMGKERLAAEQAGYADETEQIDHAPLADRFRRMASGLIPGRLSDEWDRLPDNAARVRYLYRTALLARKRAGYHVKPQLTPRETAHDLRNGGDTIRELPEPIVALYERARYGASAIGDSEAEAARTLEKQGKKPL